MNMDITRVVRATLTMEAGWFPHRPQRGLHFKSARSSHKVERAWRVATIYRLRPSQTYGFRKEHARIMANHEDRGRSWVSASSSRCPLTRAVRACGMWGRKVRYCARPHGERGMTLSPGGRDAGLEWGSAGRAVWPLRTEDQRRAPAGTSARKAFVVSRRGLARPTLSYRARGSAWLPK